MSLLDSIILGFIQGLSEFLPISSSGHLIIAYYFLDLTPSLFYSVMLHLGTLAAVVIVYRKQLATIIMHPLSKSSLFVVAASVPTFILALIAKLFLDDVLNGSLLPLGFALTIIVIILPYIIKTKRRSLSYPTSLIIGTVQGLAVLPGLSRSGSTINAAKLIGISDKDAVSFSFILSIPIIIASGAVELYEYLSITGTAAEISAINILAGVIISFISGLAAILIVRKLAIANKFYWFAIYLLIPLVISLIIL